VGKRLYGSAFPHMLGYGYGFSGISLGWFFNPYGSWNSISSGIPAIIPILQSLLGKQRSIRQSEVLQYVLSSPHLSSSRRQLPQRERTVSGGSGSLPAGGNSVPRPT